MQVINSLTKNLVPTNLQSDFLPNVMRDEVIIIMIMIDWIYNMVNENIELKTFVLFKIITFLQTFISLDVPNSSKK